MSKFEEILSWLEREEEAVGFGAVIRATVDIEEARKLLFSELGYEPTQSQLDAFMSIGEIKYEVLPKIGVGFERTEHTWGYEATYRDLLTGRFVSPRDVQTAIATLEL